MADNIKTDIVQSEGGGIKVAAPLVSSAESGISSQEQKAKVPSEKTVTASSVVDTSSDFASAPETGAESIEDAMADAEGEEMADDAGEEVGAARPKAKRNIKDIDWTETGFAPRRKRHHLVWVAVLAIGALLILCIFPRRQHRDAPDFHSPPAYLPPARVETPKSLSDLKVGTFVVNPRRSENDFMIISGDIENVSDNLHRGIRVELDLLDARGLKIATVNDFMTELGPHATWHVLARTMNARAVSARLTGIKEEL